MDPRTPTQTNSTDTDLDTALAELDQLLATIDQRVKTIEETVRRILAHQPQIRTNLRNCKSCGRLVPSNSRWCPICSENTDGRD